MPRRVAVVAALVVLASVLTAPGAGAVALKITPPLEPACNKATDWPMFGRTIARNFETDDNCITRGNVARLRPKWFFNTGAPITAQPAIVDGVAYAGTYDGRFFAVRVSTGKAVWAKPFNMKPYDTDPGDFGAMPGSPAVTTIDGRRVVILPGGASLFALDARTGALLSRICLDRVDTTCMGKGGRITEVESSPAVLPAADGHSVRVLVGSDVNETFPSGPAGVISLRLDAHGFSAEWMFDPEAGQTYAGLAPVQPKNAMKENGCSDVWASPTVDVSTNVVVFGTRNCSYPEKVQRAPGATTPVLTESIMGIDLTTGKFRWQYSPRTPAQGRGLDLDFGATPNVLRPGVVGEGGKDGVYYAVNSATGRLLWSTKVAIGAFAGGMVASTAVGRFANGHQAVFAVAAIPVDTDSPQNTVKTALTHPDYLFSVHAIDTVTHKVRWTSPTAPTYAAPVYSHSLLFVPNSFSFSLLVLGVETGLPIRMQPLESVPASPPAISGDDLVMGSGIAEKIPGLEPLAHIGGLWGFTPRLTA